MNQNQTNLNGLTSKKRKSEANPQVLKQYEGQLFKGISKRKTEIILINPNLKEINDPAKSCINHVELQANYYNESTNTYYCADCAVKYTILDKKIGINSHLNKEEYKKKNRSDAFLQRLQFYQVCLNGHLERNERILRESVQRHNHDLNQISIFFEHISNVFHDAYSKIINEKNDRINKIKEEHQQKKLYLQENIRKIKGFETDILENFENIILGMGLDPFKNIMDEYKQKVDGIQEHSEKNELDDYPLYKEIVESPRKIEELNLSLQSCVMHLFRAFDSALAAVDSTMQEGTEGNLNSGSSVLLIEEMKKINDCFYNNSLAKSSKEGK